MKRPFEKDFEVADEPVTVPANVRQWHYYPIEMPVTAGGDGPATVGDDAARMTYEVWDWTFNSHGSFDNLPDAINCAMNMTAALGRRS